LKLKISTNFIKDTTWDLGGDITNIKLMKFKCIKSNRKVYIITQAMGEGCIRGVQY
jgi:hypothetical protein